MRKPKNYFRDIPYQQFSQACKNREIDNLFDLDEDWLNFKINNQGILEESQLEKEDLSYEECKELESETDYNKKLFAYEKAFFANKTLYSKFKYLIEKDPNKGENLALMRSEFFRWLIKNNRGNRENVKCLVALYKSHENFSMYILWKSIGMAFNLPVGRM